MNFILPVPLSLNNLTRPNLMLIVTHHDLHPPEDALLVGETHRFNAGDTVWCRAEYLDYDNQWKVGWMSVSIAALIRVIPQYGHDAF